MKPPVIIGAGLSGLIAATQFPQARVIEANGPDSIAHKAVLRFRSDALSRLVGIPFRSVTVRKSIWYERRHCSPNILLANMYSRKTNGGYLDRSIWNLDPVTRYIAPEDLLPQLVEIVGDRIHWDTVVTSDLMFRDEDQPAISTIPMPILLDLLGFRQWEPFAFKGIRVDRYRVKNADVFQTVYFPDPGLSVYRASITGDLLIVEHVETCAEGAARAGARESSRVAVLAALGLLGSDVEPIEVDHLQRYGKIRPLENDRLRKQAIYTATIKHNMYSLGRFATWRNILLDDVVDDIAIIKQMIAHGAYGATLQHNSKEPS